MNPLLPWVIILGACAVALAVGLHRSQVKVGILQQELDSRDFRKRVRLEKATAAMLPHGSEMVVFRCTRGHLTESANAARPPAGAQAWAISEEDCPRCREGWAAARIRDDRRRVEVPS